MATIRLTEAEQEKLRAVLERVHRAGTTEGVGIDVVAAYEGQENDGPQFVMVNKGDFIRLDLNHPHSADAGFFLAVFAELGKLPNLEFRVQFMLKQRSKEGGREK